MVGTLALTPGVLDHRLAELIALELPGEAQLEMARLSGNRALQKQIAQVVIKSSRRCARPSARSPFPSPTSPILTSLQATMVAGIMHISGREMSMKLAGEFIAALGANVGLGLVLREGARAGVKLIPRLGQRDFGAVAGAGTYSIGQATVAYSSKASPCPTPAAFSKRRKRNRPQLKS